MLDDLSTVNSVLALPALAGFIIAFSLVYLIRVLPLQRQVERHEARADDISSSLQQVIATETERVETLQSEQRAEQMQYQLKLQQLELERDLLQSSNAQQSEELRQKIGLQQQQYAELSAESIVYREQLAASKVQLAEQQKQTDEKLALLQEAKTELNREFKIMANEIFEDKQKTFQQQNQTQLDGILKPLGDKIQAFEKKVEDNYSQEAKERFSLIKEVKNLQDLNTRISKDAVNLTNALKGESKTQGTWGEVILERVLEKSGLTKGREYEVQVAVKSEDGKRLQPDVVVHLPDQKDLIVDSKVSLTAYERFCSADDYDIQKAELSAHINSLKQHIKQLSAKDYQNLTGVRTLDFVLLFVPVEAAFSVAVQEDPELFSAAFDKNIVLVAPSTLLATLRTIQNIWRYEQQNKNAQEIANKAGALYDKFVNFVADLEDIGTRIGSVQTAYDKAHNKLVSGRGSLVGRAENMRELGAKVSKSLPQNLVEMPQREALTTVKSVDQIPK